ncbi:family 10 glycosylhydrolase [Deinococcus sp. KNUC1210]|uniref:glycoside hydrolase family 10 protein n=1 Tax=Deinococcus sp. KNUC1210 TaxID=2917691 RepID=UPI001EF1039E|nr:family 10 glycosylhydrolase [Deinococcus sp. KNUC1210]ULH15635.1 family 10 glycosylhydrolase [Deinococcus sp. KNUC1210]
MPRFRSRLLLTASCLLLSSAASQETEPAPAVSVPVQVPALPPEPAPSQPAPGVPVQPDLAASPAEPAAPAASKLRGLWMDAFGPGLKTPEQVQQAVDDAAALGVNALFVQAIRRADCLCRLGSVPPAADIAPNFDPLAQIIQLAHARGIRVLAWYSVTGAWNVTLPSAGKTQVFAQHGPDAGGTSWLARRSDGTWRDNSDAWLDPGIPGAADYMATSALNLVKHYDLDGLQLDRIRYPDGGDWGYSPVTLARYRSETGQKGTPAPGDVRWKTWKRDQVTALTRRIVLEARAVRPGLLISAATIVYGDGPADRAAFQNTRTYAEVLQDWPGWMQEGLLDVNVMMNYKRDGVNGQEGWFDRWNAFAESVKQGDEEVAAGTAMYLNAPGVTAAQAARATAQGLGWVGYSYRTPTAGVYSAAQTQPQGFTTLKAALTAPGAVLGQPLAWTMAAPVRHGLLGRVVGALQAGGLRVSAYDAAGTLLATTTTDANGYYGFADLSQAGSGKVEVRALDQRWAQVLGTGVTRFPNLLVRAVVRVGSGQ